MPSDDDVLLTFTDAGKIVGLSHSTIGKWVTAGVIPTVPMPGSTARRIRKGTFIAYVRSLESSATFATSES